MAKESGISEELPNLMKLLKGAKVSDVFKFDFAKFYPSRFSMSTLILALTFLIDTPTYQPSTFPMIKQLLPITAKRKGKITQGDLNSILF